MKRQAWYTWQASMNRPLFGYEYTFKPFDSIWPEPVPPKPKVTAAECKKHGLNLLE